MAVQQNLHHHQNVGLSGPHGRLHHHRLVEAIHRAARHLLILQPPDDRGGDHRTHTVGGHVALGVHDRGDLGQPGHGLLDENVSRTTQHPGCARPCHHLHRQNAVATQLEERLVHANSLQAEDLGVDSGQGLLHRVTRGAIRVNILIFRRRQGPGVELSVDRQR